MRRSRFAVFVLVGIAGFIVDAGVLWMLLHATGLEIHLARLLSFLASSASTWRLNRRYTFDSSGGDGRQFMEWLRYLWSSAAGGLTNYAAFCAFIAFTGDRGNYPLFGVAIGSLAGMCVNYLLYSRYVFRQRAYR